MLPSPSDRARPTSSPSELLDLTAAQAVGLCPGCAGGRRVLLVDDNPINRKVVLLQVRKLGYEADAVADGSAAMDALQHDHYALVLMDCQMPTMDGFATTDAIRSLPSPHRHVPIVALTAYVSSEDRRRCLEAGMNDFVAKPATLGALRTVIGNWLGPLPI